MQLMFGAGEFFGVPLTDAFGVAITNPTPVRVGVLQSMSVEVSGDVKELHGQLQFAVDAARGKGKVSGKAEFAQISGRNLNSLYFGQTQTSGSLVGVVADTVGALVPAPSGPYTITPTPPGSGTWAEDLGVVDVNNNPLTRVASGPTTGQYSVSAGVYTFAAADTGLRMFISYRYTSVIASAKSLIVNNLAMGQAPTFRGLAHCDYKGKKALLVLPQMVSTKLGLLATKIDDYNNMSIEYQCYSSGVGTVFEAYTQE